MKITVNWPGRAAETFPWPEKFSHGEMRLVKRVTGLRPSEMQDAIDAEDPDVFIAFVAIAVRRAHPALSDKQIAADLDALPFEGGVEVDATDEDGQSPPAGGAPGSADTETESSPEPSSTSSTAETLETVG